MKKVSIHAAKTHLSRLLREVEDGGEVVIVRRGQPVAKLSRASGKGPRRPRVGIATSGAVSYAKDAFSPLTKKELAEWGID